MKKIFIDGKAGTTGLRIYERLENRKDIEIITLSEEVQMLFSFACLMQLPLKQLQWLKMTILLLSTHPQPTEQIPTGHTALQSFPKNLKIKSKTEKELQYPVVTQAVLLPWYIHLLRQAFFQKMLC